MQAKPLEKKYCTTREAASLLGVSVGSIQQWVERGLLEAWKTEGGHRRVLRESVKKLLRQKQVVGRMEPASAVTPVATAPSLPPAVPAALATAAAGAEEQAASKRRLRVLAIDDEADLLQLYKDRMSAWRMAPEVNTCDSAVAGLVLVGRTSPDLLLVDLMMPGIDGFTLLRLLTSMPEVAETTVVVVSALSTEELARRGTVPAGVEVLSKPIPFDRLLEIAMDICTRKQLERRSS